VYAQLESLQRAQLLIVSRVDPADIENVFGTDCRAIALAFAPLKIDHGSNHAWGLLASGCRSVAHA
jgi:hypothetical protein